eukprot:TRINITY_DN12454_c0_g2_i3.p1 TRINITY_DN12454_c0_g2~~TRINITY_DN12454_c0_g2_i3.p1  ORF type:complete len:591 (+),score=125.98 TRINITY_DN12454_c0_g2_i3:29-1801(+)
MAVLDQIRQLVQVNIEKAQFNSAAYWADKAVSLSNGANDDVYLLARMYFLTQQYERAVNLLEQYTLIQSNLCCRYLAGLCYAEDQAWKEALDIVGVDDADLQLVLAQCEQDTAFKPIKEVESSLCLLRGRVQEQLDNRSKAVEAYQLALSKDPLCVEAFDRLVEHNMLPINEERKLLASLDLSHLSEELRSTIVFLYRSKLDKYTSLGDDVKALAPPALLTNAGVEINEATRLFSRCDFKSCFAITTRVLDRDRFHHTCLPLHIACQVELKDTNGLFYLAHKLVDAHPKRAISWFAVGSYYFSIGKNDDARRYYSKATQLDRNLGPAWIGFGHAFAAEGEHDQAMAAYSTAARLLPGSHLPMLYIGMEYAHTNNLNMALKYFDESRSLCQEDPLAWHESGVVLCREGRWADAELAFRTALKFAKSTESLTESRWSSTMSGLAKIMLKLQRYEEAEELYFKALQLQPHVAEHHAGLAYAFHLQDQLDQAIEAYHQALAIDPKHSFSNIMLTKALEAQLDHNIDLDTFLDDLSDDVPAVASNQQATSTSIRATPHGKGHPMASSPAMGQTANPPDPDVSALDDSTMSLDDSM